MMTIAIKRKQWNINWLCYHLDTEFAGIVDDLHKRADVTSDSRE